MSLRFIIALVLSLVCFAVPAWADFQAGEEAYNRGDYAAALRELRPVAKQGNASAQYYLGVLYEIGRGVAQDYAQARQWIEKAAAQGNAKAQEFLGTTYFKGHGVPQNFVQAHMWYNLAAANGGNKGAELRDGLAKRMTRAQIAEAHKLAREWKPIGK